MAQCDGKLAATALFVRPAHGAAADADNGWQKTDLWHSAAAIPGVSVVADDSGAEARRFGASTSGHAVLYSATGQLLFSGGITESRGHSGDNAGRSAIVSLVGHRQLSAGPAAPTTPVYGCPLLDHIADCAKEGMAPCRN